MQIPKRKGNSNMGFFSFKQNLILSLTIFFCLFTKSLTSQISVYQVLKDYDFPSGILPKGVANYDLDVSTGEFAAYFNGSCSFSLEGSYQLYYEPAIRGHISKGRLQSLKGVSVKLFWFWVNIVEVRRAGDDLEFSVGFAGAGFPVDNFEESPQCGCGLNCNFGVSSF